MAAIQAYTVVKKLDRTSELRDYPAHTLISCEVDDNLEQAGSRGFGPLVRYISGANQARQQIAMTSPVLHAPQTARHHVISFVLPEGMAPEDAPLPSDARVTVVQVPPRQVAARRFSGAWRQSQVLDNAQELTKTVEKAGLVAVGEVFYGRYDPPWKPGFARRNEALVEVGRV